MKNTALTKLHKDESNPRKPDAARLGLLRLSLSKLGFIRIATLLSGIRVGAHYLLSKNVAIDPDTGCILWQGRKNRDGYGRTRFLGVEWLMHRLSYFTYVGDIPEGLSVLHRCDTPACIAPEHLFVGTRADNVADACAKGRTPKGEGHHSAILTAANIPAIRASSRSHVDEAAVHGVSPATIFDVREFRTWRHV